MKTITRERLKALLATLNRPQPVHFTALTECDAKAAAKDELGGRLMKVARYRAWIGSYENAVNRQIAREGNADILHWQAQARQWGRHVSLALIHHVTKDGTERHYLAAQILAAPHPLYLVEQVQNALRRKRRRFVGIAAEKVAHLLSKRSSYSTQPVERKVVHRDIALDSITTISVAGDVYRVED